MKRKLLVIENQRTQHRILEKALGDYEVYPASDKDYAHVIEWVRIFLNNRYTSSRRQQVRGLFVDYIRVKEIELMIMDYMLSSCHDGGTGVQLGTDLQSPGLFPHIPIIFLSGLSRNTEEIRNATQYLSNYDWVEKGYAGVSLLQEQYVKQHLKVKIEDFFKKGKTVDLFKILDELIEMKTLEEYVGKLKALRESGEKTGFSSEDRDFILELRDKANDSDTTIAEVFKKYNR